MVIRQGSDSGGTLFLRLPHPQVADLTTTVEEKVEALDKGLMIVNDVINGTFESRDLQDAPKFIFSQHFYRLKRERAAKSDRSGTSLLSYGRSDDGKIHLINERTASQRPLKFALITSRRVDRSAWMPYLLNSSVCA